MLFHRLTDSDDTLAKYIRLGGLPGLVKMGLDEQDAREYQQDVYHTVLLKDVIMRNNIRNVPFLENLVRFLADNAGKIISANSIAKYMRSQGDNVTSTAIINYTKMLCEVTDTGKRYFCVRNQTPSWRVSCQYGADNTRGTDPGAVMHISQSGF